MKPSRGTSLQARLTLLVTALCTLLALCIGLGIFQVVERASIEALDRELSTSADVLAQLVHLERDGSIDVEDHGDEKLAIAHRIETPEGKVLSDGGLRWSAIARAAPGTELVVVDGHSFRVLTRTLPLARKDRRAEVVLRVATSARPMAELRERVAGAILFATLAAALLGALGSFLIARTTTAPLRALEGRVASLESSSLGESISVPSKDRETIALTAAFNGLLRRLHEAFERQRSLVARASHALRTPTTTILTRAEITLLRPRSEEEYRSALGEIAEAARESAATVSHLLSLARLDERRVELRREPVDLRSMAAELERLLSPRARASRVSLSFDIEEGASVHADRAALRELLESLLDNALCYTPQGGSAGLRARANELVVWDTGPGMSADDKARAFERFFRGSAAEKTDASGSGLGLAIAAAIAERHGAAIELVDRDGGGLEVVVRWPEGEA